MGQSNSTRANLMPNDFPSATSSDFGFTDDGTFTIRPAVNERSNRFRHPFAVFFHVIFKISSLLIYLFGSAFGQEFLGLFVTLVFLISIDFWVVKNVTGRLLVGLRWWNYIDDHGHSHWIFENRSKKRSATSNPGSAGSAPTNQEFVLFSQENESNELKKSSASDSTIFWVSIFLFPLFWFFFLFSAIFSLNIHWVLLIGMALVLSGSNLYGYIRCRFGNDYTYTSIITDYVGPKNLFNFMQRASTTSASTQAKVNSPSQPQQYPMS